MASRRSSILKPRKIREPLQDLNQLLPNNDEEETTSTEIQKRRVSFASINKVKEFEAAAECVTLLNTPAYDERFSISSDSCQSSVLCQSYHESSHNITYSSRRKSLQNVSKGIPEKCSTGNENLYVEEDVELTETVGRICETSLKNCRADSTIELTSVVSPNEKAAYLMNHEIMEEIIVCPMNLMKNDGQGGVEEIVELNRSNNDSSSMETTEVITNNLLADSVLSQPYECDFDADDVCEEVNLTFEGKPSEVSIYEVIPPRKSIFHPPTNQSLRKSTLDVSFVKLKTETERGATCLSNYENISMEMSALEISLTNGDTTSNEPKASEKRRYHNQTVPVLSQSSQDKTTYHNLSMQLLNQNENRTSYDDSSMRLPSQNRFDFSSAKLLIGDQRNIAGKMTPHNLSMTVLSQNSQDKAKYNLSMQLLSQSENRTDDSNAQLPSQNKSDGSSAVLLTEGQRNAAVKKTPLKSSIQVLSQSPEDKTQYHNLSRQFLSQNENQTRYNNSSMQLLSQKSNNLSVQSSHEPAEKTELGSSSTPFIEAVKGSVVEENQLQTMFDKNCTEVGNEDVVGQLQTEQMLANGSILSHTEIDQSDQASSFVSNDNQTVDMSVQANALPTSEGKSSDALHEISRKSTLNDTSSANDSNSPLTVGVNFSIFQKNKETRVEFSGTIDSNKKQRSKSISNVQVNIINNKLEKHNRNVRELRFSMPANGTSENTKPNVFASFMDVNVPSSNEEDRVDDPVCQVSSVTCEKQPLKKQDWPSVPKPASDVRPDVQDDTEFKHLSKPNKKRLSSEMLGELENGVTKRSCTEAENAETVTADHPPPSVNVRDGVEMQAVVSAASQAEECNKTSPIETSKAVDELSARDCNSEVDSKMKDRSPEIMTDQSSFATVPSTPYGRKSRTAGASQSLCEDDFLDENPLNNPSIFVNVGDSFSLRTSPDQNLENVSNVDVRISPNDDLDAKYLIESINSENISKENFVAYWLQNKTGNSETKYVEKSNSILSSQSLLTCVERKKISCESNSKLYEKEIGGKRAAANEMEPCVEPVANTIRESNSNSGKSAKECEIEAAEPSGQADNNAEEMRSAETQVVSDSQNEIGPRESINSSESLSGVDSTVDEEREEPVVVRPAATAIIGDDIGHLYQTRPSNFVEENVPFTLQVGEYEEAPVEDAGLIDATKTPSDRGEICSEFGENLVVICPPSAQSEEPKQELVAEMITVDAETNASHCSVVELSVPTVGDISNDVALEERRVASVPEFFVPLIVQKDKLQESTSFEEAVTLDAQVPSACNYENVISKPTGKNADVSLRAAVTSEYEQEAQIEEIPTEAAETVDQEMRELANEPNPRKEVLEKILLEASDRKQMWKLAIKMENVWTFGFLDKHLELLVEFTSETDSCVARLQFVQPTNVEHHEIMKIAIDSLIRKCGPKLKTFCRSVEDVPHVLKLIEPDVDFTKRFIDDMLELRDFEEVKVENGRASFYVVSYRNMLYLKIIVKIKNLDRLSINDIEIRERIGKVDASLIHRLFLESGRDYDFFSRFVEKLWQTLD